MKLVSVIIPVYNAEIYVAETLDSVVNQTYRNIEIIVVNDGSVDGSLDIIMSFKRIYNNVSVINTKNMGVALARNTGLEYAKGDFVAFLDSDDLWHPTKIEKQMAVLEARSTEWAAVYCPSWPIDSEGNCLKVSQKRLASGYIFASHLSYRFVGNGSALLVRRTVALEVGGFDPSFAAQGIGGCEDIDFELKVAKRYRIDCVPEFLVGYRRYPGNMSSSHARMARGLVAVVDKCIDRSPLLDAYAIRRAKAASYHYGFEKYLHAREYGLALFFLFSASIKDPIGTAMVVRSLLKRLFIRVLHDVGIPYVTKGLKTKNVKYLQINDYNFKFVSNNRLENSRFDKLRAVDRKLELMEILNNEFKNSK